MKIRANKQVGKNLLLDKTYVLNTISVYLTEGNLTCHVGTGGLFLKFEISDLGTISVKT